LRRRSKTGDKGDFITYDIKYRMGRDGGQMKSSEMRDLLLPRLMSEEIAV